MTYCEVMIDVIVLLSGGDGGIDDDKPGDICR